VIGLTSDEAAAVVPLINSNKTVAFGMTGQSEFDHIHFPYFYRLVPADLAESYAMVAIAHFRKHYKRVALAFGNDIGSQTFVGPAVAAIKKAGEKLVANETLDLKATTFRTEAAKVISGHPDVILTEALGPAEAAFLSEVKQQNGGKTIPVIGTSATISPDWYKSVSAALGASTLSKEFLADNLVVDTTGPAYRPFKAAIFAEKGKVGNTGNFSTYLTAPGAVHLYDGINLAALAMVASKSTSPSVYKNYLNKVATGKVTVHSFAQGLAALKKGKSISYVGPGGPTKFNRYNESNGIFQIDTYSPTGLVKVVANIPNKWMNAVR
jgi:ABC-type branched-subunit amino acid transport system substrate-binding protein